MPHPANVAPVGATAVFAGRHLGLRVAVPLVLVTMFAGDAVLAAVRGYPLLSGVTPFVYAGFVVQALFAHALRHRARGAVTAAVLGACAFFALSNLGVWLAAALYPHTLAGLAACYLAALPFFGATLAGDVVWTLLLSLSYRPLADLVAKRSGTAHLATA